MNTDVDVLIVGGGPAGSTLAWMLRDTNLKIALLDKQEFPRMKVCAGWVTPAVMQELQLDLNDYKKSNLLQPVHGFSVSQMGKTEVLTDYEGKVASYSIRRNEFDSYLLNRSKAELHLGTKFKSMQRTKSGWLINDTINAKIVVGAGGHFCPVARQLGVKLGQAETVVAAQEVEFEMNEQQIKQCSVKETIPEMFFCKDLKGYAWIVRKGNFLNVGLGREDNHKLSEHVSQFRDEMIRAGKIPTDTPTKFPGHAYLLYPHATRPLMQDGVLLIGDSLGLSYAESGEGIRPAVESAMMAAKVINDANGDYSLINLQKYETQIVERYGKRQAKEFTEYLPNWIKQKVGSYLLSSEKFVKNFVVEQWFLHLEQAPLEVEIP